MKSNLLATMLVKHWGCKDILQVYFMVNFIYIFSNPTPGPGPILNRAAQTMGKCMHEAPLARVAGKRRCTLHSGWNRASNVSTLRSSAFHLHEWNFVHEHKCLPLTSGVSCVSAEWSFMRAACAQSSISTSGSCPDPLVPMQLCTCICIYHSHAPTYARSPRLGT